ncbi:hypothetical protein FSP39_002858 [Pinctada imbricata]|uniref:Uncharacterized protein n=1 Tax=Pinctada imbricata TaxID=66713 RepID=A0AA88XMV0_PINIB|nr:hypothetical protein FSP39_002858 [Pinctada imbricata]
MIISLTIITTYYFGISFTEPPNGETEDLSDSEQTPFQSLRDVSYDLDRILQHLHNILEWSGDMTQGVVREDLLSVLGTQLQDSEMQQRGTLCNKAVRGAFPSVKMMRKGKFKTYPLFLSPLLMSCRGPKKKTVENETQNRYNETHWNSGSSDITEQRAKKGYAPLSGLYNAASKHSPYSSEIGCESTKELKVEPCDYTSGSSELHSLGFGDNWPRYKALETLKSRLAAKSAVSKVLPSYMEQLREVTGEKLDIKQEIVDEKEYNSGMLNSYANERQDEEIMHAGVDRKYNTENVYGNTGCFGDTETGETTLDLNKSLTIPMKKELEASSDEDDNNNDNCDDDDADDERSASPSIPEGDETLDDPATKSSLIMRFRRKSSTSNGKVYSTF